MSLWLVIPAKALDHGKGRLAGILMPTERHALNREFLMHMLSLAAIYSGIRHTVVVSACAEALELAKARGAHALCETAPSDLNSALEQARASIHALGAAEILVAASDVPLARADDLREMVDLGRSTARPVIATDSVGTGTNALYVPTALPMGFRFGAASCALHQRAATLLGSPAAVVTNPYLAFDVDTPEDYLKMPERWLTDALRSPCGDFIMASMKK